MTPSSSAPSWHRALGQALSPPAAFAETAAAFSSGSAAGTLRGELLELLEQVGRGLPPPPPVRPDLNADRICRRDLGERERSRLRHSLADLRHLCLRQRDIGHHERELVLGQSAPLSEEARLVRDRASQLDWTASQR